MSRLWMAFLFLLSTTDVAAQTLTRVMSGYAATSGPHAVLWLAREAGLFEKNGLRTDIAYIRSGSASGLPSELQVAALGKF